MKKNIYYFFFWKFRFLIVDVFRVEGIWKRDIKLVVFTILFGIII